MKITISLTQEEMDEIIACKPNHIRNKTDLEINTVDAIDGTLDLPGYNVEIVIEE